MKPGGQIRFATPDLGKLAELYLLPCTTELHANVDALRGSGERNQNCSTCALSNIGVRSKVCDYLFGDCETNSKTCRKLFGRQSSSLKVILREPLGFQVRSNLFTDLW
jgi:hypothetical protein